MFEQLESRKADIARGPEIALAAALHACAIVAAVWLTRPAAPPADVDKQPPIIRFPGAGGEKRPEKKPNGRPARPPAKKPPLRKLQHERAEPTVPIAAPA